MSPLSIAIVSVSATAGGAEAHTVALAGGMHGRGHDVALYGQCPGWEQLGLPRYPLRLGPKWSRQNIAAGVLRVPLERHRARAVPASSLTYLQFKREQIALTHPLSRKSPVIWTEHGRWMGGAAGRLLAKAYAQAAQHVTKVICVSPEVASDLSRMIRREKLVVIPNAVDTQRFAPLTADQRLALRERLLPEHFRDRRVAVLAARLHRAKRHDRAIAAALASGSALMVVGDGPDRPRLEALSGRSDDVYFVGHRDNVVDYLATCDFYLYCGAETDGTPTAVLEAAATGLPVVAFAGDPGTELVRHLGGLVIEKAGELTPQKAAALTERWGSGVAYVERHHSRRRWLDAYESVFRECAG